MKICVDCRFYSPEEVCRNSKCDTAEGTNLVDGSSLLRAHRLCWFARMATGPCGLEAIYFEGFTGANRPASGGS